MKRTLLTVLCLMALPAMGKPPRQSEQKWRDAFGDLRASVVEGLFRKLYPSASLRWGYELQLLEGGAPPIRVALPGYVQLPAPKGWKGATGLELGDERKDYARKTANFEAPARPAHLSEVVVFRADASSNVGDYKRMKLDTSEAVTEIDDVNILEWSDAKWPALRVSYSSYYSGGDFVGGIGWEATFDAEQGALVAKIPKSISRKTKMGVTTVDMLAAHKVGPGEIEIDGALSKKTIRYSCGDPCVVDGATLLTQWSQ